MSVTPLNLIDEFDCAQIEELTSKFSELNIKDKKRKWSDTDMAREEEKHNVLELVINYIENIEKYIVIENDDLEDGEIVENDGDLEDGEIVENDDDLEEDTRMDVVEDEEYYIVEMEDSGPLKLSDLDV
jgi:hypothetical protein